MRSRGARIGRWGLAALLALPGLALGAQPPVPPEGRFEFHDMRVAGVVHRYAVWLPPGFESRQKWPGIVFLHGSGESGTDGERPTQVGLGPALAAHPERWPFVVVFPQKPLDEEEWEEREDLVFAARTLAERSFRMDGGDVALVGISQGGHGTWMIGARHASRWSCLVAVCGYGRVRSVSGRVARLPVWAFHGLEDDVVLPEDTRRIIDGIHAARERLGLGGEDGDVRLTLYPHANHNAWDSAFAEADLPGWILAH
jgi:predicted peptidase